MRNMKLWLFIAAVVAVVVLNYYTGLSAMIADGSLTAYFTTMIEEHPVQAALFYILVSFVGSVLLALPGVVFAIFAGVIFGPVWGTLFCWASMSLGCSLSFLVGRYFLQDTIKPQLQKSKVLNRLLFESVDRSDMYLLAVTRLVPVFPFNLQNFAYGITDMGFWRYTIFSALFILPGTAVYTIAAAGVVSPEQRTICLVVAIGILVAILGAAFVLRKKEGI